MPDLLIMLIAIVAVWIFGNCALYLIARGEGSARYAPVAMAIGFTGVIITVNPLYYVTGLGMPQIRYILLALLLAAACFLALTWKKVRPDITLLFWTIAIFIVLALPALIGGEQYYVFRGNWWDHFTYITAAYGFANHPLGSISQFTPQTFLANELLAPAQGHSGARPSVMLLFSLFLDGRGDIYLRAFLYTSALLAMAYPPLYFICSLIRNVAVPEQPASWVTRILPAGFILGFWGQYIFDINAWGQLASLSLTLAFIAAFISLLQEWQQSNRLERPPPAAPYFLAVLLFAGAWFVYPESALVHIFMTAVATVVWVLLTRGRAGVKAVAWLAALPFFSLLFALPNYQTTISFILSQASFGSGTQVDWWLFHDAYIVGIEPPMMELVSAFRSNTASLAHYWYVPFNSVLSLFGLYFVTPARNAGIWWYPWAAVTIACALLFISSFVRGITDSFRNAPVAVYVPRAFSIIGLCICLYFFVRYRWWPAGKLLSYVSPYIYLVMMLPLLQHTISSPRRWLDTAAAGAAVILLTLSLGFGAARVYASTDKFGIGFYRNYPSIQGPDNKIRITWDFKAAAAGKCSAVNVDNLFNNPFFSHYVKLELAYAGIPFYTTKPIVGYFGKDEAMGFMPFMPTDCSVILQSDTEYRIHAVVVKK